MEQMPPGYRFYPTEEELVSFYLHKKLEGKRNDLNRVIPVLDIFEQEPCHLPKLSGELCHRDMEQWFFFVPRQEREARGGRPSRTTASGYWKATGSPNYVYSSDNRVIGMKKTMVFYKGKAPSGRKTKWKMNEYKAIHQETSSPFGCAVPKLRHELSVCRVYVIQGSSRAFDRRPLGAETRRSETQQIVHGHEAMAPISQATAEAGEKTSSSPESSYSGEDHFELPRTDLSNINGQELPLWEWEELNWP